MTVYCTKYVSSVQLCHLLFCNCSFLGDKFLILAADKLVIKH